MPLKYRKPVLEIEKRDWFKNHIKKFIGTKQAKGALEAFCTAGSYLEKKENWCKNEYQHETSNKQQEHGQVCLLGAVGISSSLSGPFSKAAGAILGAYINMSSPSFSSIPSFNDHPKTTHEDVLDVLEDVATLTREALAEQGIK